MDHSSTTESRSRRSSDAGGGESSSSHSHHHSVADTLSHLIPSFLKKHHDHSNINNEQHNGSNGVGEEKKSKPHVQIIDPQGQMKTSPASSNGSSAAAPLLQQAPPPPPQSHVEFLSPGRWLVKGEPWSVPERYTLQVYLGGGSYGSVAKAIDDHSHRPVAVKKIIDAFKGQTHALRVLREIAILRRLHHPYIIRLVDVLDPPPPSIHRIKEYVIFEFGGTDLQQLAKSNTVLNTAQIQKITKQLMYAVAYLHDAQVIHRDLKPANVLIDPETLDIRLADFGLARVLLPGKSMGRVNDDHDVSAPVIDEPVPLKRVYTEHVVTRWYRAPEVILSHGLYSTAIDVWSVGCIFAELLGLMNPPAKRRPLFPGRSCFPLSPTQRDDCYRDQRDQLNVIFSVIGTPDMDGIRSLDATPDVVAYLQSLPPVKPMNLSDNYPNAPHPAFDLLRPLLHFNAARRPSLNEALNHPFLRDADPIISQPPSVAKAMLKMDIEHRADKRSMIKSLEEILRNEIGRMHSEEPDPDVADDIDELDDASGDFARFVRVHSGDLSSDIP